MFNDLTKWVGTLAPFIAPYPGWVKVAFAVLVLSGATLFVGLIVAAPKPSATAAPEPGVKPTSGEASAWLVIKGVTGFGSVAGKGVRVTANVNGIDYMYPSIAGVEWMQIGPEMASQTFQIPVRDTYTLRFAAQLRDGPALVSVEEQRVNSKTNGVATYGVRQLDRGQRSASIAAEIRYTISRDNP